MTRRMGVWILVLLLSVQWLLPSMAFAGDSGKNEKQVRVIATSLNVRSGPGTTNAIVASLAKDATATLIEVQGDWTQIRLEDGTLGWAATKFLEVLSADEMIPSGTQSEAPASGATKQPRHAESSTPAGTGGGSAFRGFLKWGSLVGAAAVGGLALNEHSKGNSSYDEYKELFNANRKDEAEEKYQDAKDHDSKAQTFAIVGGSLFGLFLLQQFVFTGGDEQAELTPHGASPAFAWNPSTGEMRASLSVRF
jgi:hypothetical protein